MISNHKLNKTKWDFLRYDLDYKKEVDYFRELPSHYTNNYYYTGLLIDENSSPKINDSFANQPHNAQTLPPPIQSAHTSKSNIE